MLFPVGENGNWNLKVLGRKSVNLEMNAVLVPMKGVVLLIRWARMGTVISF